MQNKHKRTICITGASSGIGAALAHAMASPQTHLILIARNPERLSQVTQQCQQQGATVSAQSIDVTDQTQMVAYLNHQDEQTPIDLLVANAGCGTSELKKQHLSQLDIETRLWQVHLQGTLNTLHPVLARMQERKRGHIAIMSSINAFIPLASSCSYGAAKAALLHYGKALRGHLTHDNIDVSVICPGWVDTHLTQHNTFPMPWIMPSNKAANIIMRGLTKKKPVIAFPWIMRLACKLYAVLPGFLQSYITAKT